jgi:hypothetical protein
MVLKKSKKPNLGVHWSRGSTIWSVGAPGGAIRRLAGAPTDREDGEDAGNGKGINKEDHFQILEKYGP